MGDAEVRSDDQRRVYGLAINYLGRALKLYGIARARIQIVSLVQMNLTKRMKEWGMKEFGLTLGRTWTAEKALKGVAIISSMSRSSIYPHNLFSYFTWPSSSPLLLSRFLVCLFLALIAR